MSKFLRSFTSLCLSSLVTSLTFFSGLIPDCITITGISFLGSSSSNEFLNALFCSFEKSLNILSSSCSSVIAGFKSMLNLTVLSLTIPVITLLALNITGPLTPKCVKSISPKSVNTFLRLSPIRSSSHSSLTLRGTRAGSIGVMLCPRLLANL